MKGIKTDKGKVEEGQYTYAENLVFEADKESRLTSEKGTLTAATLLPDATFRGVIRIDSREIIFTQTTNSSQIYLFDPNELLPKLLVDEPSLDFSYPIKGTWSINNGCDTIIYWNDYNNPDRYLNIDVLDNFKDNNGEWDINKMRIDPTYLIPEITEVQVNDGGGSLDIGSWALAIEIYDDNFNPIYLTNSTVYYPIYSVPINQENPTGAFNLENRTALDGGKPVSNKSIQVTIDTKEFPYYRIYALRKISGDGATVQVSYDPTFYSNPIYTLRNINNFVDTTVDEVKVLREKYESSWHMNIVKDRLNRYNIKTPQRDYSNYQSVVNNITTKWKYTTQLRNSNSLTDPNITDRKGLIPDEIVSLGISFIHADGEESPVFHIPGHEATGEDRLLIPYEVGNPLMELIGIKDNYERWEVENTATLETSNTGSMGYFETDTDYPNIVDCNGNRIYPEGKIRHHRLPSRSLIGYPNHFEIDPLTIDFNVPELPASDVVDYRFHIGLVSENERTVLDSGLMLPVMDATFFDPSAGAPEVDFDLRFDCTLMYGGSQYLNTAANGTLPKIITSPKILLGEYIDADYIEVIRRTRFTSPNLNAEDTDNGTPNVQAVVQRQPATFATQTPYLLDVEYSTLLSPFTIYSSPNGAYTMLYEARGNYGMLLESQRLQDYIAAHPYDTSGNKNEGLTELETVVLKKYRIPFRNLQAIRYKELDYVENNILNFKYFEYNAYAPVVDYDFLLWGTAVYNVILDSPVNYSLRVEGLEEQSIPNFDSDLSEYLINKSINPDETVSYYPEYNVINPDFERGYSERDYFSLPDNYDYCQKCTTVLPNTHIWSDRGFPSERENKLLLFRSNNKQEVGQGTGPITFATELADKLYIRTRNARFVIPIGSQRLQTNANNIEVGSADFMSVPPIPITNNENGYLGGAGWNDEIVTQMGIFSVDNIRKRIHLLRDNSIEDLTSPKFNNEKFLRETIDEVSVWYYNENNNSLILHNQTNDYQFSFDLDRIVWEGFHSYKPDVGFSIDNKYYTIKNNIIYLHEGPHGYFYNQYLPYIIEVQYFNYQTTVFNSINIVANSKKEGKPVMYPLFTDFWVYNDFQSTGKVELVQPDINYTNGLGKARLFYSEKDYRITDFLSNQAFTEPVTNEDVTNLQPINVGNKSVWEVEKLRDKVYFIRLYSDTKENLQITIDLINTFHNLSIH